MVGLISKDSMAKYLLVEVDGPRGTDAPGLTFEFYDVLNIHNCGLNPKNSTLHISFDFISQLFF